MENHGMKCELPKVAVEAAFEAGGSLEPGREEKLWRGLDATYLIAMEERHGET